IRLVNNLLDISRLDTGNVSIEYTNCDIVKVIEDIVTSVAEYVKDAGVEIVFDTEIEEKVISVDPEKIERIMLNLLSNAVKFSGTNGRILVSVYERNKKLFVSIK
ncbi:MAG: hypothetical protein N2511_08745, partial [Thermodesulfovibrionales bacterium]|nr:hypothetical protein [Thermodesulfovibrionales bacterium]